MAKWNHKIKTNIKEVAPGLHLISNASSKTRLRISWLLQRKAGNVLFHGPDHAKIYDALLPRLKALGGVKHHLLTHAPEASKSMKALDEAFGTLHHISKHDVPFAQEDLAPLTVKPFDDDARVLPGIQSFCLPGHTLGFTAFRFSVERKSYLVMGDVISEVKSGWKPRIHGALIDEGLQSLEKLKAMKLDWLLPNQANLELSHPPLEAKPILSSL